MNVETEPDLVITTEDTDVQSLRDGDLLHIMFLWPHLRVVDKVNRGLLLAPNRRSRVTLVDSEGVEKQFHLSPKRKVSRVTNPAIAVGPWSFELGGARFDLSEELRSRQRDDALWHKALWPVGRQFLKLWRVILDLQCRAYSLKLRAGFWGAFFVILAAAVGLVTRTSPELSVAVGIVGAFIVERCWEQWRSRTRRKLAKGILMRVRYRPFGPGGMSYGTLRLGSQGKLIVGGEPGQVWFSTEMRLLRGKRVLAACAFANDLRGDLRYTTTAVAEAIRHRLDSGSRRMIYAPSSKHDPTGEAPPDITISPSEKWFTLTFSDKQEDKGQFSIRLKLHQARVFADVLEVMDAGRRL